VKEKKLATKWYVAWADQRSSNFQYNNVGLKFEIGRGITNEEPYISLCGSCCYKLKFPSFSNECDSITSPI
jgi:hypothetical protein